MNTVKIKNIAELKTRRGTPEATVEVLGYYTEGDGGGGTFYWDNTSTITDNGGTVIQVTGVVTGRWIRNYGTIINPKFFGAKLDGITNDTVAIQATLDNCNGKTIVFTGNTVINNTLNYTGGNLNIDGGGYSISHTTSENTSLNIQGTTSSFVTNAIITKGDTTITLLSTTGLVKGDVLYLVANISDTLWSKERSYFYKGEFVEIDTVLSTTQVILKSPVIDSYITSASLTKLNDKQISIKNLSIKRNNNTACLTIYNLNNIVLDNCNIEGSNERCIYIYNSYNISIINCSTKGSFYTGTGTSYGLCLGSVQNADVRGGYYIAGRHGITTGGTFPNRYISFNSIKIDNDINSIAGATTAFDFHSNIEYSTISNIISKNGITLSGINIEVNNCISYSRNQYAFLFLVNRDGDNTVNINGLNLISSSAQSAFNFSSIGNGTTYTLNAGNVNINNVSIHVSSLMSIGSTSFMFSGSSTNNINYKSINISNISICSTIEQPSGTYGMGFALNNSTINSDAVINISNTFIDFKARCFILGFGNIGCQINISNSFFKSFFSGSLNYNSRLGIATYRIQNTTFDGQNNSFVECTGGNVTFISSNFLNMSSYCFYGNNLTYIAMNNCTKNNTVTMYQQVGTSPKVLDYTTSSNNTKIITGSAAPTTGTWLKGDITYNTNPLSGGNLGWICTTAGTPGTWVAFGDILSANGNTLLKTTSDSGETLQIVGDINLKTAGNKLKIATGSNASVGTATLVAGTATVTTTAVTTNSLIFVTYNTPSGTLSSGLSVPSGSIVNGTSFVINSLTTSGTVNTSDVSTVRWWIIN